MDPPEHCRQSRAEESHADPKANNKCIMHSNLDACAFTCICIRYEKNIKTYKRFKYGIYGDYPFHLHGFFLPLGAHAWWFQPPMSWAWPRSHGKCSIRFMRFWGWTIHEMIRGWINQLKWPLMWVKQQDPPSLNLQFLWVVSQSSTHGWFMALLY